MVTHRLNKLRRLHDHVAKQVLQKVTLTTFVALAHLLADEEESAEKGNDKERYDNSQNHRWNCAPGISSRHNKTYEAEKESGEQ